MGRIEANRKNAQKSTGPKDTTSTRFNAVKHGLLAEGVTELDSPETFADFCAKLEAELKPLGELETFLARRIALCMVRLRRAMRLEAEHITAGLNPPITDRASSDLSTLLAGLDNAGKVVDAGLPASLPATAVGELADGFCRYEAMIDNRLHHALNQLRQMQAARLRPA